jgi:hypothetical protein
VPLCTETSSDGTQVCGVNEDAEGALFPTGRPQLGGGVTSITQLGGGDETTMLAPVVDVHSITKPLPCSKRRLLNGP